VNHRVLTTTALVALFSTPAFADNERGLYLGAGIGQFNVKIDNLERLGATVRSTFDGDDTTYKLFAGWRFMPYLAVELDYLDLGKPEETVLGSNVKTDISGVAPYLIGTLPVGPVELFAKVGYYFYDVKIDGASLPRLDESDEDFAYGAGVGITFFEHVHARLEYEIIDVSVADDADAFWLSGAWRF